MGKKFIAVSFMALALGLASAPRSNAGDEMIIDNSAQAPPPAYSYAPPPPVVYVQPPPVQVVVYPTYRNYARPVRVYGYDRIYVRRRFCHHDRR
jgi:hypothetical protein